MSGGLFDKSLQDLAITSQQFRWKTADEVRTSAHRNPFVQRVTASSPSGSNTVSVIYRCRAIQVPDVGAGPVGSVIAGSDCVEITARLVGRGLGVWPLLLGVGPENYRDGILRSLVFTVLPLQICVRTGTGHSVVS